MGGDAIDLARHSPVHRVDGDRSNDMLVRVYERASSPDGIRPGQELAIPVELAGGGMRQWHLPAGPETYEVALLPSGDPMHAPRRAIVGANCVDDGTASFMCVTLQGAELFVFHSREGDQPVRCVELCSSGVGGNRDIAGA